MEKYKERDFSVCGLVFNSLASKSRAPEATRLLQPLLIPKWIWENISMGFVSIFPRTTKGFGSV